MNIGNNETKIGQMEQQQKLFFDLLTDGLDEEKKRLLLE